MFSRFARSHRQSGRIASVLYGAIVAQSRVPDFYARLGVPDSVDGRFEMVVLHLALVLRGLRNADDAAKALGQSVFDVFCVEMDRSFREMGVGDLSVPKRMKRMAEAYYGRAAAYDAALAAGDRAALAAAVRRNLLRGAEGAAEEIAAYAAEAAGGLESPAMSDLREGRLAWPDPAAIRLRSLA
jgi:cytochrome b pre-mRNA-processing protein 3